MSKFITELSEEVHNRLTSINVKGKTVTLKLKVRAKGAPKETAKFLGRDVIFFDVHKISHKNQDLLKCSSILPDCCHVHPRERANCLV